MVRGRISPKTKDRFRKTIRDVVKGLSRKVEVYKQPLKYECPNCYYDKLTSKSTGKCKWLSSEIAGKIAEWQTDNPTKEASEAPYKWFRVGRCPVCRGEGYLEVKRKVWIDCLVTWSPSSRYDNQNVYTPAGIEGSTTVRLKTDPKYYELFKNCKRIYVDGIECKLSKPPILRGLGNQALLIIFAFTTDKPKIDSGEIIKEYT
jgi:hypothetical protein